MRIAFSLTASLSLMIATARADDDAPPPASGGLLVVYKEAGGRTRLTRFDALPRLFGPGDHAPHPAIISERFEVVWTGQLEVPHTGTFTFSLRQENVDSAKLSLGGEGIALGKSVELPFGPIPFVLRTQDADEEVRWNYIGRVIASTRSGSVRASSLTKKSRTTARRQSSRTALQDRGAVLAEAAGCFRCHEGPKAWTCSLATNLNGELLPGPRWTEFATVFTPTAIRRWLRAILMRSGQEPSCRRRPTRSMNRLATLSHYIFPAHEVWPKPLRPVTVRRARQIYKQLGCATCHEAPKGTGSDLPIPPLTGLAAKWTGTGLAKFLRHPLESRPRGRMPDFSLTDVESSDLAAFLLTRPDAGKAPVAGDPIQVSVDDLQKQWIARGEDGDKFKLLRPEERLEAVAGRQLAAGGCFNCHDIGGKKMPPISRRDSGAPQIALAAKAPPTPPLIDVAREHLRAGCLAETAAATKAAPRFQFSAEDRHALAEYVGSLNSRSSASLTERLRPSISSY